MARLEPVLTLNAPPPGGHYSQAMIHNGLVYVAGQLPIKLGQKEHVVGSIEAQAETIFANLDAILLAAGSRRDLVIRTTVYISDVARAASSIRSTRRFLAITAPRGRLLAVQQTTLRLRCRDRCDRSIKRLT